jgi:murein L,D-transpeptidase YafK
VSSKKTSLGKFYHANLCGNECGKERRKIGAMMESVEQVVQRYKSKAAQRFAPLCKKATIPYPPPRLTLVGLKEEKQLEIWAGKSKGKLHKLATYPILAASGTHGPKRYEGDLQVPEGFYAIDILNPQSRFHLSMRVNYPNLEDQVHRTVEPHQMGGDIYIHGNRVSIGCLAMGDPAIEEIFTLVALSHPRQRYILICPRDLRTQPAPPTNDPWVRDLYKRLAKRLKRDFD